MQRFYERFYFHDDHPANAELRTIYRELRASEFGRVERYQRAVAIYNSASSDLDFDHRHAFHVMLAMLAWLSGHEMERYTWLARCLADLDEQPERCQLRYVFWEYKNALINAPDIPELPLEKIHEMLEDFTRRLQDFSEFERTRQYIHCSVMRQIVPRSERDAINFRDWVYIPRDPLSHCAACELSTRLRHLSTSGLHEEAIAAAKPALDGESKCDSQPHSIFANLLDDYRKLGRIEEGNQLQERGYRMVRDNHRFISSVADHIEYLARTDRTKKALNMFERHAEWIFRSQTPDDQFEYYKAGLTLLTHPQITKRKTLPLRLPEKLIASDTEAGVDREALTNELHRRAKAIAERYDRRNGNDNAALDLAEATQW